MTRDAWFAEHPEAAAALDTFVAERQPGTPGFGFGPFSLVLRERFGYPFGPPDGGPDTNLGAWVRQRSGEAPRQSLASMAFHRPEEELQDLVSDYRRFVVTCAQNNTDVDHEWLDVLERYCLERDAALLVVPIRYKNPTSRRDPQDESDDGYWWHERVQRYLLSDNVRVHPLVQIRGFDRPQATSPNPLGGMETVTKGDSAVFGHPQYVFKTIPTQHHRLPKMLCTTGAVTVENYSSTPLGVRADFHHTLGAVVIELRDDQAHPHIRELKWSVTHRNLIDQDRVYTGGGHGQAQRALALIPGDEHVRFHSPDVRRATYDGDDAIVKALRPEVIVRHDVFDCHSVTYHHRGKHLTQALMAMRGADDLRDELEEAVRFIQATTPEDTKNYIVFSNHNHMLSHFLQAGEAGVQPRNKLLYHELCYRMLSGARVVDGMDVLPDPFEIYFKMEGLSEIATFLGPDDSRMVAGIEVAMHGHLGPNGARGSVRNLSKIGVRSVIGHVHSPEVLQGVYAAGTSSHLRLEYNDGPSGWMNTHVVILANGERQMIHIIEGEWR